MIDTVQYNEMGALVSNINNCTIQGYVSRDDRIG